MRGIGIVGCLFLSFLGWAQAVVLGFQGEVNLELPGWGPGELSWGQVLPPGARLVTQPQGLVLLTFPAGQVLMLRPGTQFEVPEVNPAPSATLYRAILTKRSSLDRLEEKLRQHGGARDELAPLEDLSIRPAQRRELSEAIGLLDTLPLSGPHRVAVEGGVLEFFSQWRRAESLYQEGRSRFADSSLIRQVLADLYLKLKKPLQAARTLAE